MSAKRIDSLAPVLPDRGGFSLANSGDDAKGLPMAHEMTINDRSVFRKVPAWHLLGRVFDGEMTATQAQSECLPWSVEMVSLFRSDSGELLSEHRGIVRADTRECFGVVGAGWSPVQNSDLASLVDSLAGEGGLKIESCGSIRGGRRVWFLARGESVWTSDADESRGYLAVCAGHDGTLAVRAFPTTIRVVCSNTFHLALGRAGSAGFTFKHSGNVNAKLDECRRALKLYSASVKDYTDQTKALNAKEMTADDLRRFWVDVYSEVIEPIPATPTNTKEREAVSESRRVLAQWASNFDRDRSITRGPASAWSAFNAVTEWFDHSRAFRGADNAARRENKANSILFGSACEDKRKAFDKALALV